MRKLLLFFPFLFLFSFLLFPAIIIGAQAEKTNADTIVFPGPNVVDNEKFDSLIRRGSQMLAISPDSVWEIALKASLYYDPADYPRKIKLLNLHGIAHFIQSSYEKALYNYMEGLALSIDIDDDFMTSTFYNNIAIVNFHTGNYMESLEHFLKAIDYFEKTGEFYRKIVTLGNMGRLYSNIENYEKATEYLDTAYGVFLERNDSTGMAEVNNARGGMFLLKQEPDSALYYLQKSIDIDLVKQNKFRLSGSYLYVAKVYFMIEDYQQAINFFKESEKVSDEINYKEKSSEAKIGMARAYLEMGDPKTGLRYADEAIIIAEQLGNNRLMKEIHHFYSDTYERAGNFQLSLHHNRIYLQIKDKLIDQSKLHQLYNIEISELSQAKEIQTLQIERQQLLLSRKNAAIISIIIAFLLVMGGAYLLYRNYQYRQLANHQQVVLELNEKRARAAVEAEMQERKRIGQELHDGLGQMLSVARLNISVIQQKIVLSNDRKVELLEGAISSVDKAFYELRSISHNLAPSMLSQKGFTEALIELAEQVNKSQQMMVHLEIFGVNDAFDDLTENTLFRATQELLNNAIKHAKATDFFLQIIKDENQISLMVEDNGIGFDPQKAIGFNYGGLHNIKSRVENLKGSIDIDTVPDRGTIVNIQIPLKPIENTFRK